MKKNFLYIGLLLAMQITSVYTVPRFSSPRTHVGVYFSGQFSDKTVNRLLANIARVNGSRILSQQGVNRANDAEVVDFVMQNPHLFADAPKTLVVISDAPFNSKTEELQKGRKKLAEFPLIKALFYNCPSFGQLSQAPTLDPRVESKYDKWLGTTGLKGDKEKISKFDEFVTLLRAKFEGKPWLNDTLQKIEKYRASVEATLPKEGQKLDAQQWQENIRIVNDFSQEDFQSLAHENIMHMLGIPEEEYATILADPSLKRSIEWMGKFAFTVGLGGAASDILNLCMFVAGIDPAACTKQNVGNLVAAAHHVITGVIEGTLTPAEKQRFAQLQHMLQDAEIDDMVTGSYIYHVNGTLDMTIVGTENVIKSLQEQGYTDGTVMDGLTVRLIEDSTLLNEKNALQGVKDAKKWFAPIEF